LRARVAELEATLRAQTTELAAIKAERDSLRKAYEVVLRELELLRHRLFVAKAERVENVAQLELEFAAKKAELEALVKRLEEAAPADDDDEKPKTKKRGGGRRNLHDADIKEVRRIEILDPALEGVAERIGFEETCQLGYMRGGPVKIVTARAKYKKVTERGPEIHTAPVPKQLLSRSLMAPSMLAHMIMGRVGYGMTYYRMEDQLARDGIDVDRGSISRYHEDVGAALGATIVAAMQADALANAFCLATDATGVSIQPTRVDEPKQRRPCDKGHFFVVLADRSHVFFEFQPKHTSEAVCAMFRNFGGYLQADAHTIYDALYRGEAVADGAAAPTEVACWSHCRRYFWEAAMAKQPIGREALLHLRILFEQDTKWTALPPAKRYAMRNAVLGPLIDDFFRWVHAQAKLHPERGPVASALGYAINQEQALRCFLDDGRLAMTNNASERALRTIAIGRKNWLFFGSGDHAAAAANLFSLVASCKLHGLDPELYLRDVIRVVPHWPTDRFLELSPLHWANTRARLDVDQVDAEVGDLTIPPPPEQ